MYSHVHLDSLHILAGLPAIDNRVGIFCMRMSRCNLALGYFLLHEKRPRVCILIGS